MRSEKRHYDIHEEEVRIICEFIKNHQYRDIEYFVYTYPGADFRYQKTAPTTGLVLVNYDDNYSFIVHDGKNDDEYGGERYLSKFEFTIYDETYDLYYPKGKLLEELNKIVEIARDSKYIGKTLEKKLSLFGVRK